MNNIKNYQGFTLLEVMLAMAVLAMAGVAILGITDTNVRNLSYLETKMMANWVASDRLVDASLASAWPPRNNRKGKVELAGVEWYWQQKVIKTTDKNMRAIKVEVRLEENAKSPLTSLMTYVSKQNNG